MVKTTTPVIVFYILYFVWLFGITYLTPELNLLNYFSGGVVLFYFIFLREKGDMSWFLFSCLVPIVFTVFSLKHWQFKFDLDALKFMPIYLPLAWGTTVVALRKFYTVITSQ